jgi:hypothetical protein
MWVRNGQPELNATKSASALDIAWSAGIWEGEGCIRLLRKRGVEVTVVQKDTELLYRLRDWFGGSIRPQGTKSGCSVWSLCGDRARLFIALIFPYLTARRRKQVDAAGALEFMSGESTCGMSQEQINERLYVYYQADTKKKWRSPEFWRSEEFREKNRESMRRYRARKREEAKQIQESAKVVSIA